MVFLCGVKSFIGHDKGSYFCGVNLGLELTEGAGEIGSGMNSSVLQ